MTTSGVLSTIDGILSAVTSPTFTAVYQGEPLSIPTTPIAAFWLTGHREDFTTLSDASTVAEFMIRCYWRLQTSADVRETVEVEMWNAIIAVKAGLRGDSALSGNAADSRPGDAQTGYIELGGNVYRHASIPFTVNIYSEATITP